MNSDLPSGGDLIEVDFYESVEEPIARLIKEISPRLGLAPLPNTARPDGIEFRIWTNLDALGDPNLLGVQSRGNENKAYFFVMDRRAESIKLRRERLPDPKSGWNKMLFEVRSRLTTPKGLVRDPNFELDRDEPVILLEVFDKGGYRKVFYGRNTSFQDGKRLIEVCEYLAAEFDVVMDCRRE